MTVEMNERHDTQDSAGYAPRHRSRVAFQRAWYVVRERASHVVRQLRAGVLALRTPLGRRKALRWALIGVGGLAVLALVFFTLTRTGRYLTRAGWEESKILWRRRSIAKMVADTSVPRATRRKLQLVLDAREFARRSLDLKVGRSFTTYSALEHDTLVLVLSAAYRDRLVNYRWWFPIVGRVPYKGFFDFKEAVGEERRFQKPARIFSSDQRASASATARG